MKVCMNHHAFEPSLTVKGTEMVGFFVGALHRGEFASRHSWHHRGTRFQKHNNTPVWPDERRDVVEYCRMGRVFEGWLLFSQDIEYRICFLWMRRNAMVHSHFHPCGSPDSKVNTRRRLRLPLPPGHTIALGLFALRSLCINCPFDDSFPLLVRQSEHPRTYPTPKHSCDVD